MKKIYLIIGAILVILIIITAFTYNNLSNPIHEDIDWSNSTLLNFDSLIKQAEECQGYRQFDSMEEQIAAGYSQFCYMDLGDSEINQLKALNGSKIFVLCDTGRTYNDMNYKECSEIFTSISENNECQKEWNFQTAVPGHNTYRTTYQIYECKVCGGVGVIEKLEVIQQKPKIPISSIGPESTGESKDTKSPNQLSKSTNDEQS